MAPRLLAGVRFAAGTLSKRHQMANLLGIAPVTESSGKAVGFISALLVRSSTAELSRWAALSIPQSKWARAYYELQCRRGKKHMRRCGRCLQMD